MTFAILSGINPSLERANSMKIIRKSQTTPKAPVIVDNSKPNPWAHHPEAMRPVLTALAYIVGKGMVKVTGESTMSYIRDVVGKARTRTLTPAQQQAMYDIALRCKAKVTKVSKKTTKTDKVAPAAPEAAFENEPALWEITGRSPTRTYIVPRFSIFSHNARRKHTIDDMVRSGKCISHIDTPKRTFSYLDTDGKPWYDLTPLSHMLPYSSAMGSSGGFRCDDGHRQGPVEVEQRRNPTNPYVAAERDIGTYTSVFSRPVTYMYTDGSLETYTVPKGEQRSHLNPCYLTRTDMVPICKEEWDDDCEWRRSTYTDGECAKTEDKVVESEEEEEVVGLCELLATI